MGISESRPSRDSNSNASVGGAWTGKIYFDPEASKKRGKSYYFTDDELKEELIEVIGENEVIDKIAIYSHPLSAVQPLKVAFKHTYMVLETDQWWWSLEKNNEGLTLQRSKKLEAVRDRYRQAERTEGVRGISKEKEGSTGKMELMSLIKWLWYEDCLRQPYHWLESNCQHFTKKVFDKVAKGKTWQPNIFGIKST